MPHNATAAHDREPDDRAAPGRHREAERILRDALALLIARDLKRGQVRIHPLRTVRYVGLAVGSGTALALAVHRLRAAKQPGL